MVSGINRLFFDEETHTYTVNGKELLSVTKFVKMFFPAFDADKTFWHGGVGKKFTIAGWVAYAVREEIRGRGPVSKKSDDEYYYTKRLFKDSWEEEVNNRKHKRIPVSAREVKRLWTENGINASDEGTRVHKVIERYLNKKLSIIDLLNEPVASEGIIALNNILYYLDKPQVIPEHKVFDEELGLAGTIDVLILPSNNTFLIADWKLVGELTRQGDRGLTPATKDLTSGNLTLYELQLSVYAYIIERTAGRECCDLIIMHLTPEGKCEPNIVRYQKEKVESMIREYHEGVVPC